MLIVTVAGTGVGRSGALQNGRAISARTALSCFGVVGGALAGLTGGF